MRLRVIVRSPDAMDLSLGIRVVRFRANNAGSMGLPWSRDYIRIADVAKIEVVAKIVAAMSQRWPAGGIMGGDLTKPCPQPTKPA